MPFPIDDKLVVAVSSTALFDLREEDEVFQKRGEAVYRDLQRKRLDVRLEKGVAFPFIKRLLALNDVFADEKPIEVILLSKNDPDTGNRVWRSISDHGLPISRGALTNGSSPHPYIPSFNASLFLSADEEGVKAAVDRGYPGGLVLQAPLDDDEGDTRLRMAFDFDGVLIDDEAESVFRSSGSIDEFHEHELSNRDRPHNPGPLKKLYDGIARLQRIEAARAQDQSGYERVIEVAIVTARNAPSHERLVTTLRAWNLTPDKTFLLGGISKDRILQVFKPHIFFDDQIGHLEPASLLVPSVHVPFGVANAVERQRTAG